MAFYNLRSSDGKFEFTDWEIYYYQESTNDNYILKYPYYIYVVDTYKYARILAQKYGEEKALQFVEELNELKDKFFDFIYDNIHDEKIKHIYEKGAGDTYPSVYEKDLKIIYNYFLPLQKDFAKKWDLYVNCD